MNPEQPPNWKTLVQAQEAELEAARLTAARLRALHKAESLLRVYGVEIVEKESKEENEEKKEERTVFTLKEGLRLLRESQDKEKNNLWEEVTKELKRTWPDIQENIETEAEDDTHPIPSQSPSPSTTNVGSMGFTDTTTALDDQASSSWLDVRDNIETEPEADTNPVLSQSTSQRPKYAGLMGNTNSDSPQSYDEHDREEEKSNDAYGTTSEDEMLKVSERLTNLLASIKNEKNWLERKCGLIELKEKKVPIDADLAKGIALQIRDRKHTVVMRTALDLITTYDQEILTKDALVIARSVLKLIGITIPFLKDTSANAFCAVMRPHFKKRKAWELCMENMKNPPQEHEKARAACVRVILEWVREETPPQHRHVGMAISAALVDKTQSVREEGRMLFHAVEMLYDRQAKKNILELIGENRDAETALEKYTQDSSLGEQENIETKPKIATNPTPSQPVDTAASLNNTSNKKKPNSSWIHKADVGDEESTNDAHGMTPEEVMEQELEHKEISERLSILLASTEIEHNWEKRVSGLNELRDKKVVINNELAKCIAKQMNDRKHTLVMSASYDLIIAYNQKMAPRDVVILGRSLLIAIGMAKGFIKNAAVSAFCALMKPQFKSRMSWKLCLENLKNPPQLHEKCRLACISVISDWVQRKGPPRYLEIAEAISMAVLDRTPGIRTEAKQVLVALDDKYDQQSRDTILTEIKKKRDVVDKLRTMGIRL